MKQWLRVCFSVLLSISILFTMCTKNLQAIEVIITENSTGINNGYYYSFWNHGGGSVAMTLGGDGNYSVEWKNCFDFTCGKGWIKGSPNRTVSFTGSFDGGNNGSLALHGQTKKSSSEYVEYYVIESYGYWVPPGWNSIGTMESDGGTYKIYSGERIRGSFIMEGEPRQFQYYSVRTTKRSSGTITFSNHVEAWKSKGLNLGTEWDYQIMEVEGYQSSGSANITVSEYIQDITPTYPPTTTPAITKKYGDVNGDGIVDSADYTVFRQYLLEKISLVPCSENADVNGDKTIDSGDYTILRQYLLGIITTFPVESGTTQ